MDLTLYDCMNLFSVSKKIKIILRADDESEEEYILDSGWASFDLSCKRKTWKYCQVSHIDAGAGYIIFWIEV